MTTQTQHAGPDEREEFEKWAKSVGKSVYCSDYQNREPYAAGETQECWSAWRARAALLAEDKGGEVATLRVFMDRADMGQSLAPNPPYKVAVACANSKAESLPLGDYKLYTRPAPADSKAGGEVFGWFMRLGTYAPVFLEQSDPPHPFTFEEAVAEGWRPLYAHPQQQADSRAGGEVVAWLYTLEYGNNVADTKVSLHQLNYPFGVLGADYVRENEHGVSYVRQTKLYK